MRRRLLHPPKSRYNYITATFNVIDTTNPTLILGWNQDDTSVTFDMSLVYNIIIDDDVIITPRTHYVFNTTGDHKVVYYLNTMVSMYNMFRNCVRLTSVDLTNVDTNNVINMRTMFHMCNNLTNIIFNNEWDTSKVIDIGYMFYHCGSLLSSVLEPFLYIFDTGNCTTMDSLFNGCISIKSLRFIKFPKFRTHNVTNMKHMFSGCTSLISYDWQGKYEADWLGNQGLAFANSDGTSVWDTSKVTSMEGMFNGCNNTDFTYLNLKWTYPSVTNFKHMFAGCVNMYTLTMIGELNDGLTSSDCTNMFYNMPNYGNFYYNANEPIYSSVITPMLIAKHWSCEAS